MKLQKGFTLIELILYIALSAIILLTTAIFLTSLLQSRVKNQTIATVNQEGNQAMSIMTQALRNATSITSPTIGTSDTKLVLVVNGATTTFDLENGVITMKEGSNSPVALTSNLVVISNLLFKNLSRPSTPGNVDITFTVDHIH